MPSLAPVLLSAKAVSDFVSLRRAQDGKARTVASEILLEVKRNGFGAIADFTQKFDGVSLGIGDVEVSRQEIEEAEKLLLPQERKAMQRMKKRIGSFAKLQRASMGKIVQKTKDGFASLEFVPVGRVGIYVPAGRAPLFSSLFMAAVPARVAGAGEIVVLTPPQKDGRANRLILAAAGMCGIEKVYKIGGAQAIGALAFGVDGLLEPVDAICGPGNAYVSAAKQIAAGMGARIDVPAGPSEILVIADGTANPSFAASDMLAQAEHGADSVALCICTSQKKASDICGQVKKQLEALPKGSAANESIQKWGRVFVAKSVGDAIDAANRIAPEHLELYVAGAKKLLPKVKNAGAVFVRTAEAFCDYGMGGGNHILPTSGSAKAWGGVSVQTFGKWMYVEGLKSGAQKRLAKTAALLARMEGLEAHARAAEAREEKKSD